MNRLKDIIITKNMRTKTMACSPTPKKDKPLFQRFTFSWGSLLIKLHNYTNDSRVIYLSCDDFFHNPTKINMFKLTKDHVIID